MAKTTYKPRPAGSLKQATESLINAAGGQSKASDYTRVSPGMLFKYCDPDERDRFMPIDIVRVLERVIDDPIVTRFLAAEAGYILMPIAVGQAVGLAVGSSRAAKESADVFQRVAEALADSEIGATEAGQLIVELDEAIEAFNQIRSELRAHLDGARSSGPGRA